VETHHRAEGGELCPACVEITPVGIAHTAVAAYEEGTLRLTNANYVVPEGAWLEASADMTWVPRPVNELIERKAELLEHWNELVGQIQG
jgi:hypothetical protein